MTTAAPSNSTDAPPRFGRVAPEGGPQPRVRRDAAPKVPLTARNPKAKAMGKKITDVITFGARMLALHEPFDGKILESGAPKLGETYAAVLEKHPKALAFLTQLETGGVYGAAALATIAVAFPIMAHHMGDSFPPALRPIASYFTATAGLTPVAE